MKKKTFYYTDELTDDFAETVKNLQPLPDDYAYIHDVWYEKLLGFIAYRLLLTPFAWVYVKLKFGHKFVRAKEWKKLKEGHFIYSTHTLPLADVFLPSLITLKRKTYLMAGAQANSLKRLLGVMRSIGSIPLTGNPAKNREMLRCVKTRLAQGASITIFPEAHVWPLYTKIRPYPATSFKYAVMCNAPVLAMTNCFQKRKFRKTPKVITFIDGPFYPDPNLDKRERAEDLHRRVYETMQKRAAEYSTYSAHEYIQNT